MKGGKRQLAIVVPFRNRHNHLQCFVLYMVRFLSGFNFRILVIEQCSSGLFNKGLLMNIGYSLAKEFADWICFHDVDMLPVDSECDYSYTRRTRHLAGCAEQFGYSMPYPEYCGGVLLTTPEDFEKANGFSNEYWGWGGEDDDLFLRFLWAGVKIEYRNGRYKCLPHDCRKQSSVNCERLKRSLLTIANDERLLHSLMAVVSEEGLLHNLAPKSDETKALLPQDIRGAQAFFRSHATEANDFRSDGLTTLRYELVSQSTLSRVVDVDSDVSGLHQIFKVNF